MTAALDLGLQSILLLLATGGAALVLLVIIITIALVFLRSRGIEHY